METPESNEITKFGKKLVCPVCDHDRFWSRTTLMNTRGATFFKVDWANKKATNYVCDKCGYVFWFLEK
jgi:predicted RNA-binding Zn-ribbon protein involved in translation (DUF1610 family)